MVKFSHIVPLFFIFLLVLTSTLPGFVQGCKDIVACGDATAGEYNLLLKVRDPSRPGLQVLCVVPEGYKYTYHHPWTGKPMDFRVQHRYIGVATKEDTLPNIVKPGMIISDVGVAFGDADTMSNWKNPTRNAWDDFDWMRYACEQAGDEDEAVALLTKDLVDTLHATGVSENLFVVGPTKAYVIEADAFRYTIQQIDDVLVMSNYPKDLWKTQRHKKFPIASSFDTVKETYVQRGRVVRLNSLNGVKIVDIRDDRIVARQVPFVKLVNKMIQLVGTWVEIHLGERKTVGDYSVELLEIDDRRAKVSVMYKFKAWEDAMMDYIQSKYGSITIRDMMNWSRLHSEDLDGLRPMCEDLFPYESAVVYKIPQEDYELLSSGWFVPNHACSSIYVPVHIADTEIYAPYQNGEAAQLSLDLLQAYGHGRLTEPFTRVEEVFLNEIGHMEYLAQDSIQNSVAGVDFLTVTDVMMQKQAWLTEQLWFEVSKEQEIHEIIDDLWKKNYSISLTMMKNAVLSLRNLSGSDSLVNKIIEIALSICESRIDAAASLGKNVTSVYDEYQKGKKLLNEKDYSSGFDHIQQAFHTGDMLITGYVPSLENGRDTEACGTRDLVMYVALAMIVFSLAVIFAVVITRRHS